MSDLTLTWNPATGYADLSMIGPELATGGDLQTAVIISLFTDQTASPDDALPVSMSHDPRGWWADTYEADQIGSKLWQVFNRPTNQDTLNFARDAATQALQWMIDDGVAAAVSVTPSWLGRGGLRLDIIITEPSGVATPFSFAWRQEV